MGYGAIRTQLFSVPPWACAFALAMLTATFSDWLRMRFVFIVATITVSLTGFIILLVVHDNKHLQYAALFLAAMGTYSAMPIIVCWFNTNCAFPFPLSLAMLGMQNADFIRALAVGGHHRRAVGTAFQIGFGNSAYLAAASLPFARLTRPNLISALRPTLLPFPRSHLLTRTVGGIIAVFAFLAKDAPKYIPGYSICIAFIALSLIANIIYFLGVSWENRTRDCDAAKGMHVNLTEEDKKRMGDLNPDYRYFT